MSRIKYARMKIKKLIFNFRCRHVAKTPPVRCSPHSKVVILSQLYHPDVTMFLLAAKSFARFVPPSHFVIVDDGLTEADRALLSEHLSEVRYVTSAELRSRAYSVPSGGAWERLMAITELNDSQYVIQVDADTLTIRRPDEVIDAVEQGHSFTLGTPTGRAIAPVAQISQAASGSQSKHVQTLAEAVIDKTSIFPDARYVRGCAGFAGFRPGTLTAGAVQSFSDQMRALLGDAKWREWGSEQVTSNFFVANSPGAVVLPVDMYPFWSPERSTGDEQLKLIHFFGTFRFHGGAYTRLGRQVIQELV